MPHRPSTMTGRGHVAKQGKSETAVVTFNNAPKWDDAALKEMDSFESAIALVQAELGGTIVPASELGNGFTVLNGDDKVQLVGLPCLFMGWTFNLGDQGEFVSATVVAKGAGGSLIKAIVNDGSTGIYKQLRQFTEQSGGKQGGLAAANGLRYSEYYVDTDPKSPTYGDVSKVAAEGFKKARTYYIDNSA